MSEAKYQKSGRQVTGYDETGFIYVVDIYLDVNNPNAEYKYKYEDEDVIKINENTYKVVSSGTGTSYSSD